MRESFVDGFSGNRGVCRTNHEVFQGADSHSLFNHGTRIDWAAAPANCRSASTNSCEGGMSCLLARMANLSRNAFSTLYQGRL